MSINRNIGLEFLRGDPDRGSWFRGTLSTSQLIAIILILGAALLLPRLLRTQPVTKPASP